jgi:hypothetical protein
VGIATEKLKKYTSPGIDLTLAELLQQWKEPHNVPLCKNGNKTGCSNYQGISLLSNFIQNFIQYSPL